MNSIPIVTPNPTALLKQRSKFLKAHTSSGYKKAIDELLGNPDFRTQLNQVKAVDEVKALQSFYDALSSDPDRACYSFAHVAHADDQLAIDTLLVTDKLFKSANFSQRGQYVALVESVKEHGGRVVVFSSMHVTGAQLDLYTGVAATLRFPLPDLDLQLEMEGRGGGGKTQPSGTGGDYDSDFSATTDDDGYASDELGFDDDLVDGSGSGSGSGIGGGGGGGGKESVRRPVDEQSAAEMLTDMGF